MNPFKRARATVKKRLGKNTSPPRDRNEGYYELLVVWPDGTWKKPWHDEPFSEMDRTARGIIVDCWANEQFLTAQELAGYALNPGMYGDAITPVPTGWRPSEKILKMLFAREKWDVSIMHYMVGEMTNLKTIKP